MATTGTYNFGPDLGTLGLTAFSRLRVKRTELGPQHLQDLRTEANLLQIDWVNQGVLLWEQDTQTFTMNPSQTNTLGFPTGSTYSVPSNTVMVLDLFITPGTPGFGNNRLIYPFSRTDYASLGNPSSTGFPTSFFFLRTVNPTLTFWPVPDNNTTYTVTYWRYKQMQDAVLGANLDIQALFLNAFVDGVAARLCPGYGPAAPNGAPDPNFLTWTEKRAKDSFDLAMKQNTENVPLYISPGLEGYYRS